MARKGKNTVWTPDKVRQRIRVGVLVTRLKNHALGKIEMTATQIKAAEILLKKAVPDLKSVEHSGELRHRHTTEMTDAELAAIATGSSPGTAQAQGGAEEPPPVH